MGKEAVNVYTFEVGDAPYVVDMTVRATTEDKAREAIAKRLADLKMTRTVRLAKVEERVGWRAAS